LKDFVLGIELLFLSVQVRNRQLEYGRKGDPEEVWDVDDGDPADMGPDSDHRPDERDEYEKDVDRGKEVVFESKLKVRKGEVEDEVEHERKRYNGRK
jgi:hypothetical protein